MKRAVSILLAGMVLASAAGATVFAHGGHGRHGGYARYSGYGSPSATQASYEICTIEGCQEWGLHEHDGEYYYCAYHGTGLGCGRGWRYH